MSDCNGTRCPRCGSCNTETKVDEDLETFECLNCHHSVECETTDCLSCRYLHGDNYGNCERYVRIGNRPCGDYEEKVNNDN